MHKEPANISSVPKTKAAEAVNIFMAAGGTGGHVYPAIAIADALKEQNPRINILFVGTKNRIEWDAVPKAGYKITSLWISGFQRRFTLKNLLLPIKLLTSLIQSWKIIDHYKPDVVISCGGYAAGPVSWMAARKGISVMIQEQNSYPGITNRLLGKKAQKVFLAFDDARTFFPDDSVQITGNPTRNSLTQADKKTSLQAFGFSPKKSTLLILGGSGGAKSINEAVKSNLGRLHNEMKLQIIWQCGGKYYDQLRDEIAGDDFHNLRMTDFIHEMDQAYAAADLVVSRAGALSCSELALTGKPSILVPSPNVAGDHQSKNAQSMVDKGASELIEDHELKSRLSEMVKATITDDQRLEHMHQAALALAHPDAAQTIAREIIAVTQKGINDE